MKDGLQSFGASRKQGTLGTVERGWWRLLPANAGSVCQTALVSVGMPVPALFPHPQHAELPGKHCRRRKARTVFSDSQLSGLEKRFEIQRYLSTPERVELATALSLSETQVSRGWEEAPDSASCASPLSSEIVPEGPSKNDPLFLPFRMFPRSDRIYTIFKVDLSTWLYWGKNHFE